MNTIVVILTVIAFAAATVVFGQSKKKKMQELGIQGKVSAPIDSVWNIMVNNFGDPAAYTPNLFHSELSSSHSKAEVGTERMCTLNEKGSKYLKEEIVFLDEKSHHFTVKIKEITQPLNTDLSRVNIFLTEIEPSLTQIKIRMSYRTKPAFVGALAKGKFRAIFEDLLIGLNHYALTGERVNATSGNFKEIKAKYN